jgi:uncharacterized membrane protein YkoI
MNPARKLVVGGAVAGTALLGVVVGAATLGTASAATDPTTPTSAPSNSSATTDTVTATQNDDATEQHDGTRGTETALTGDDAAKATAAAQAAVPGATVDRVETDADGATYEVHMTKADGSEVTVKLDANFAVTATEADSADGRGHGHRGGPHEANGVTETALTGDDAAKATAAAQAAVPGATVDRVETDADGATYEAHMTKADGSEVTVKLDANFAVTGTVVGKG